jgi:hypothetical protein
LIGPGKNKEASGSRHLSDAMMAKSGHHCRMVAKTGHQYGISMVAGKRLNPI